MSQRPSKHAPPESAPPSLVEARLALGMSQRTLGELLGVSRSTMVRWHGQKHHTLLPRQLDALVRALHEVDADLATRMAATGGHTLESLGIVAPLPPPPVVQPPPAPRSHHPLVVDTVVCAAAELVGQTPASVRPLLIAAFERASDVDLSVEVVLRGLRQRAARSPQTPAPAR